MRNKSINPSSIPEESNQPLPVVDTNSLLLLNLHKGDLKRQKQMLNRLQALFSAISKRISETDWQHRDIHSLSLAQIGDDICDDLYGITDARLTSIQKDIEYREEVAGVRGS